MQRPCCLIVEDEALIGMSLEAFLEDQGFTVAGPFPTNEQALAWLERNSPTVALIDVMLMDGACTRIARALKERAIPFAIYSGLRPETAAPELADVPWLEKPARRETLIRALGDMMPSLAPA